MKYNIYNFILQNNDKNHIIYILLDIKENEYLLDGNEFIKHIRILIKDEKNIIYY